MATSHFLVGAKSEAFRTRKVRKSSGTCEDSSRDRSHKLIEIEGAIINTLHFPAISHQHHLSLVSLKAETFSVLAFRLHVNGVFGNQKRSFFLERRVLVYVWTDGNGGF